MICRSISLGFPERKDRNMTYELKSNVPSPVNETVVSLSIPATDATDLNPKIMEDGYRTWTNKRSGFGPQLLNTIKYRTANSLYQTNAKELLVPQVYRENGITKIELHANRQETWSNVPTETSSGCCDASEIWYPASCSITVHVPRIPNLTEDFVKAFIARTLSLFLNVDGTSKLLEELQGGIILNK